MKPMDLASELQPLPTEHLINELQSYGVRLVDPKAGADSRRGGAGPSDHKALTLDGMTVMVPVHTAPAFESPYLVEKPDAYGRSRISRDGLVIGEVSFPLQPKFYGLLHRRRHPLFQDRGSARTRRAGDDGAADLHPLPEPHQDLPVLRHRPVAGGGRAPSSARPRRSSPRSPRPPSSSTRVKHMVMTTGTPPGKDRGAAILTESAAAVKAAVDLPIQVQCEPPDDDAWFARMHEAGADALGMHLEACTEEVRARIMPGKAQVSVERYFQAFEAAVPVFGRGQVSTYILAGLGDSREDILAVCDRLDPHRRLPLRRALRADLRHAAGKPPHALARLHERHSRPALGDDDRARAEIHRGESRLRQMRRLLGALHL